MTEHIFTGFGFGPIQGGLFAREAFQSGNFTRIVAAEIDAQLVDAVRANNGSYYVNVAKADGIEVLKIDNVELLDPNVAADKKILLEVLAQSTEITTCLPSVDFYKSGGANSVASLTAEGLKNSTAKAAIIYTAENHNHAARILEKAVTEKVGTLFEKPVQFLNTVIAKMSRVVTDPPEAGLIMAGAAGPAEIAEFKLEPIAPGIDRAFLVEQFNRILVSRTQISDFKPGIEVFIEKDDLIPFEEAKLYGHNAIHSLLGFIAAVKGYVRMTEVAEDREIMQIATMASLDECGAAIIKKYAHIGDELFTEAGFRDCAEDLLNRMTNPYLGDTVARVVRDAVRKLAINGRIFGTMQLALEYGIEPTNMALGAMAGIAVLLEKAEENNLSGGQTGLPGDLRFGDWRKLDDAEIEKIIKWLWVGQTSKYADQLIKYVQNARGRLRQLTTDFTD